MKPLRSDAEERRRAILAAAEIAFAEKGIDVPLGEICAAAGVGRATLYRSFENRMALLGAIMRANVARLEELVDSAMQRPDGLEVYLGEIVRQQATTGGLYHLVRKDAELDRQLGTAVFHQVSTLSRTAHAAGVIGPDVTPEDIETVIRMMGGGLDGKTYEQRRALAPKVLRLALAALRG